MHRVTVIHAVADDEMKEGEFRLDRQENGKLHEFILYYGKARKGLRFLRQWKNWKLLKKHYQFAFSKAIEWAGKPDIIHLQVIWPLGQFAADMSRKYKVPLVITEHWTGYQAADGRYTGRVLKSVSKRAVRRAKMILTVSEHLHNEMLRHGLKGEYRKLSNVVDTSVFRPASESPEKFRFIHVSSLDDAQKNVTGLIRAFGQARKRNPELELVIVGSGNDESAIRRFSNEQGLTTRGIQFLPFRDGLQLASEMQQSGALVLNSRYENQPVVMLEALCCGIPVIAPKIGGIPEELNEHNGVMFPVNDEEALTKALIEVAANASSFNRAEIARSASALYGTQAVAQASDEIYRYLAG